MAKPRHIALSVPDPWKTAEFDVCAFEMEVVGETDSGEGSAARQKGGFDR